MSHDTVAPSDATQHLLIMAYGGPDKLEDVRPYLLDVRNYRATPDAVVDEITERYAQIGGRSPILELTEAEAAGIEKALNDLAGEGERWKVRVGMRHWHPFIKDVLAEMQAAGVERAVALVMAPHYSSMSIGAYFKRAEEAGTGIELAPVKSWNLNPGYLAALHERIADALEKFPAEERRSVPIIFTAHSLPERILEHGDPYPDELHATVEALVENLPGQEWHWAYQSAAMTADPWLGPDAGEVIEQLHQEGKNSILICPIGFGCEHVEILFDIDIEYQELAHKLGVHLERIEMLNDHPAMLAGLAQVARGRATDAGWLQG
jgi:ferrochelatase